MNKPDAVAGWDKVSVDPDMVKVVPGAVAFEPIPMPLTSPTDEPSVATFVTVVEPEVNVPLELTSEFPKITCTASVAPKNGCDRVICGEIK